jgi:hypothetical protein
MQKRADETFTASQLEQRPRCMITLWALPDRDAGREDA